MIVWKQLQSLINTFDLTYCITMHVSQEFMYDFSYSIYEYQYFDQQLLYISTSRSTKKSCINLINHETKVSTGYVQKITDSKGESYNVTLIPLLIIKRDRGNGNFLFEKIITVEYI